MKKIIAGTIVGIGIAVAGVSISNKSNHIGPSYLYPNPIVTTGKYETLEPSDLTGNFCTVNKQTKKDICLTYSQSHRDVNDSLHKKVYDEYNIPQEKRNIQNGEVDHFYPLCAGGSNDISNLWYEPKENMWKGKDFGFQTKDRLESFVCLGVKKGSIDPKVAYEKITSDWVSYYFELGLDKKSQMVNDDLVE